MYETKPDISVIYPEHQNLVYLLLGISKYHEEKLNVQVNLSKRLRNILEELVSSYEAECIFNDELEGYARLKLLIRQGVNIPIKKWNNNYLINVFVYNFESIQDSDYLDNEVKYFLESLKQECDIFFSSIDIAKYIKYGVDYCG